MTCTECGSIMARTDAGGGRCANCGHVTDRPYEPLSVYDLGVGGAIILDAELAKANARIAELERALAERASSPPDITKLRALLAAATPPPWRVSDRYWVTSYDAVQLGIEAPTKVVLDYLRGGLGTADAALIVALRNEASGLLDRLEAAGAQVTAWRKATECDSPADVAEVVRAFDCAIELAKQQREEQAAELSRLRELQAVLLAWFSAPEGPTLAGGHHERKCRCRFHRLEAAAMAAVRSVARKPEGR